MPQRNQAVAFADPGYDDAVPNPPPVRTTMFWGYGAPQADVMVSEPNVLAEKFAEFDRTKFENKSAETAAARDIAAYLLRLEVERQFGPLRTELEAVRKELELQMAQQSVTQRDFVSRTAVMRDGAIIVGAGALVCWLGTLLSGTVLVHPLISIMLLVGSLAFYFMSKLDE
jgi:hypothetical protein